MQRQDCAWCISIIPCPFRHPPHEPGARSAKFTNLRSAIEESWRTRGISLCLCSVVHSTSICLYNIRAGRDFPNLCTSICPTPEYNTTLTSSSRAFPHHSATSLSHSEMAPFANLHLPPIQSDTPRDLGAKCDRKNDCTSGHVLCPNCHGPIRVTQYCFRRQLSSHCLHSQCGWTWARRTESIHGSFTSSNTNYSPAAIPDCDICNIDPHPYPRSPFPVHARLVRRSRQRSYKWLGKVWRQ